MSFLILCAGAVLAQNRPAWMDQSAQLVYPRGYDSSRSYPLVIWLPYTGGTALESFTFHQRDIPQDRYLVLLPPGRPQRTDYLPAFDRFVGWYEQMILKSLGSLVQLLGREPSAIVLAGHSLGGDLAWALSVRNPHRFDGVVLSGTRASQQPSAGALEALNRTGTRFYFFLGQREDRTRREGMNRAIDSLRRQNIPLRFHEIPGAGHQLPPYGDFIGALEWVLASRF